MRDVCNIFSNGLCLLALCVGMLVGCYDDRDIREQLDDHQSQINELMMYCTQQNTNLEALHALVIALQEKNWVTDVSPVNEGGTIVGYTLTFSRGGSVTIYHGKDGYAPLMGVREDAEDGKWYWTLDGEWLTDYSGNRICASVQDGMTGDQGVTPQLKVVEGYWYVSYDGGVSWETESLGKATGDVGYTMFESVRYDEEYLYIVLSGGEELVIPCVRVVGGECAVDPESIVLDKVTASTATFRGCVDLSEEELLFCSVLLYYQEGTNFHIETAFKTETLTFGEDKSFSMICGDLSSNTSYSYCFCIDYRGRKVYSDEVKSFTTQQLDAKVDLTVKETPIVSSSPVNAQFDGAVTGLLDEDRPFVEIGLAYSDSEEELKAGVCSRIRAYDIGSDGSFEIEIYSLPVDSDYYYCSYICHEDVYVYGDVKKLQVIHPYKVRTDLDLYGAVDLSSGGAANSYVISKQDLYKFRSVKGNSLETVGDAVFAEILWETFGTSDIPEHFDLIKAVCYKDGYVVVQTADVFKEGNAVVAVKDADGNILWSWHLWFTDVPQEQVYFNDAGTMMDRNLGAVSAVPGDVGALGLFYQWGRKDPFLGSASIKSSKPAESTAVWPSRVTSDSDTGTIEYAISNPMTFIYGNSVNRDWYYTGDETVDSTRWTTSERAKSIYDPCPAGWRVPDGGADGVWSKAYGSGYSFSHPFDSINSGMNISSGKFGGYATIWYPAAGYSINGYNVSGIGVRGEYWSASVENGRFYGLRVSDIDRVYLQRTYYGDYGYSIRCIRE